MVLLAAGESPDVSRGDPEFTGPGASCSRRPRSVKRRLPWREMHMESAPQLLFESKEFSGRFAGVG